jgi:uncharacterized LabA/DUF88 family protein
VSKNKLKAAVFIDHSNLASPILEPNCKKSRRIDYKKLRRVLLGEYHDMGTFMFMGVADPMLPKKQKFMSYLSTLEYVIITVPLIKRSDGTFEQKQLDIIMHEQMISIAEASEIDAAILVSGDADFVVTAMLLQNMNKHFIVWSWKESFSLQLKEVVGEGNVFYIDDIWEEIKK